MNVKLQDKLNEDFPNLFRKRKPGQWGCRRCECSDGWHDIIREACECLTKLNIPELRFQQVKEKFGGQRIILERQLKEKLFFTIFMDKGH